MLFLSDGKFDAGRVFFRNAKWDAFSAPWEADVLFSPPLLQRGNSSMAWAAAYDTLRWAFAMKFGGIFAPGFMFFRFRGQVYALRRKMKRNYRPTTSA